VTLDIGISSSHLLVFAFVHQTRPCHRDIAHTCTHTHARVSCTSRTCISQLSLVFVRNITVPLSQSDSFSFLISSCRSRYAERWQLCTMHAHRSHASSHLRVIDALEVLAPFKHVRAREIAVAAHFRSLQISLRITIPSYVICMYLLYPKSNLLYRKWYANCTTGTRKSCMKESGQRISMRIFVGASSKSICG